MQHAHRGAHPGVPWAQTQDQRIVELDLAVRELEAIMPGRTRFARDSVRASQTTAQGLGTQARLVFGLVVHAIPRVNWYKVQLGGIGTVGACFLRPGGLSPLGPRSLGMARPGDLVIVHYTLNRPAAILGVFPSITTSAAVGRPDMIVQGGGGGIQTEQAHSFPITGNYKQGGVLDFSAGAPLDQTSFDQGWIAATGLAITIDDFMIQARVNETCGIWMTYFDSWLRVAGLALDIESAIHGETARDDEGESHYVRGIATYPWEALGLPVPGTTFTETVDPKTVQFDGQKAAIDLPDATADVQPLYRYLEHGGYLGQGHLRTVLAPTDTGVRRYSGPPADVGLFRESIALDGSLTTLFAKSGHIGKRVLIPVPKQHQPPEAGTGDDFANDGADDPYRFSSQFGDGATHRVGDVAVDGDQQALRRIAGVDDLIAYDANWKPIHPFHYHTKDYEVPDEAEAPGPFTTAQEHLDFSVLADQTYLPDPESVPLRIDHRYGDVDYYMRESFVRWHEDGSIHIACGGGAEIVLAGGKIRLAAPGGIDLLAGTDLVAFADQIVLRAQGSIDLSSSHKDVRIKAEQNVQVLAGNGGAGGVLIEAAGTTSEQAYEGKFGEDVSGAGIVLRAPHSPIASIADSIYLHTDADAGGDIVLDAADGNADVKVFAGKLAVSLADQAAFAIGPHDDQSDVDAVFVLATDGCTLDAPLAVGGNLVVYGDGDLSVPGKITAAGDVVSAGTVYSHNGGELAKAPDGAAQEARQKADQADDNATDAKTEAKNEQQATFGDGFYAVGGLGNSTMIAALHFSYRDPPTGDQYHTADLVWPETRWQMMSRLGQATGGSAWTEPPVVYQGSETYPYPGRNQWASGQSFFRLRSLTMFDPTTGAALARPGPYEDPKLADWETISMEAGFMLNRQSGSASLTTGE